MEGEPALPVYFTVCSKQRIQFSLFLVLLNLGLKLRLQCKYCFEDCLCLFFGDKRFGVSSDCITRWLISSLVFIDIQNRMNAFLQSIRVDVEFCILPSWLAVHYPQNGLALFT